MTRNISITLDDELLKYLDELAEINSRSRSSMISWLIKKSYDEDKDLDKEYTVYCDTDSLREAKDGNN